MILLWHLNINYLAEKFDQRKVLTGKHIELF